MARDEQASMSLLIDSNEPLDFDFLLTQMGIPTQRGSYNMLSGKDPSECYSDFTIFGLPKTITVSRKQATEILGDIDKVEDQIHREIQGPADNILLMYEGVVCWHADGVAGFSVEPEKVTHERGRGGHEYDRLVITGRVFHQPYQRWISFVEKLWDVGIPVVGTGDIRGSAVFLARLHEGKENTIFSRLIKQNYILGESDMEKRGRMLSFMGLSGAKIGQEVAGALVDAGLTVGTAALLLAEGGHVAEIKLPSGRRVGTAAELNLMRALGISSRVPSKDEYVAAMTPRGEGE